MNQTRDRILARTPGAGPVTVTPDPGLNLAQALFLAGFLRGLPLCAGLGRCGLCRVRFLADAPEPRPAEGKRLSAADLAWGWRLACLHPAAPCEIEVPAAGPRRSRSVAQAAPAGPLRLAVDLGTTSLHWQALSGSAVIAQGSELNPQGGLGAEIMSRLAFAARPGGAETLRRLVADRLREIVAGLPAPVEEMVVAGNPAMVLLLLGLPTNGLTTAPYRLDYAGGEVRELPGLPRTFVPPLLAPFVGADLSAGLTALALGPEPPARPFLLADLGTNGEFVLAPGPETYLCASVPLGPALEGLGLRFGRTAGPGGIESFQLAPDGPRPVFIGAAPTPGQDCGLTGPAYLSLVSILLGLGLLTPEGQFAPGETPLARRLARHFGTEAGEPVLRLDCCGGRNLFLAASDVEEILKLKAAFNLAFTRLLAEAGLAASDLAAVYLAGAVAEHARPADLERLGFLPAGLLARVRVAGNTSLAGARLLAGDPAARDWVLGLPPRTRTLDLTGEPDFAARYLERMVFSHVS